MSWSLAKIFENTSDLFVGLAPLATAQAMAAALTPIAGSKPLVVSYGEYAEITFTPEQEDRVSAWILTQLRREPGPVRIQSGGLAMKVITRQYWPWILGIAAAGAAAGYMAGRR